MNICKIIKEKLFHSSKNSSDGLIAYKYRVWDKTNDSHEFQRRIITHNELYLSSPNQFNDPFDSSLPFQYRKKDLKPKKIYKKMYQMSLNEWPYMPHYERDRIIKERIGSGAFIGSKYSKEIHEDFIKKINKEIGIYSLSENKSNILMWSHYADSHKGYCVGLDYNILLKKIGSISPVIYSDKFPQLSLFPKDSIADFMQLFITKSKDWAYEKEVRIIMRYKARHTIKIPDECIKEIIFGYKMEKDDKNEIIDLIKTKSTPIAIYEATANSEKFKLDINKKNLR
ncbi:MAG: DUF2971 domain-containing protein [Chlorobi bacterium]|nr:DUF2971 domain-containing protein [Chlorobiota bacterium]